MTQRVVDGVTYDQTWDDQNRLTSVEVNSETTSFEYDADGQRLLSIYPDGTKVYSPFPGFEEEILPVGGTAKRKTRQTYTLGGQLIGTRVKAYDSSGNPLHTEPDTGMYYFYTDAQGSVARIAVYLPAVTKRAISY